MARSNGPVEPWMSPTFRAGRTQVLTRSDHRLEGFDLPASSGNQLTSTQSLGCGFSRLGRILRPLAGKSVALFSITPGTATDTAFPPNAETGLWLAFLRLATRRVQRSLELYGVLCRQQQGARVCKACASRSGRSAQSLTEESDLKELRPTNCVRSACSASSTGAGRAKTLEALIHLGRISRHAQPEGWAEHVISARRGEGRA